ncbi:hypothetical protein GCM10018952_18450 [Streptosporangium vulgare]
MAPASVRGPVRCRFGTVLVPYGMAPRGTAPTASDRFGPVRAELRPYPGPVRLRSGTRDATGWRPGREGLAASRTKGNSREAIGPM